MIVDRDRVPGECLSHRLFEDLIYSSFKQKSPSTVSKERSPYVFEAYLAGQSQEKKSRGLQGNSIRPRLAIPLEDKGMHFLSKLVRLLTFRKHTDCPNSSNKKKLRHCQSLCHANTD